MRGMASRVSERDGDDDVDGRRSWDVNRSGSGSGGWREGGREGGKGSSEVKRFGSQHFEFNAFQMFSQH